MSNEEILKDMSHEIAGEQMVSGKPDESQSKMIVQSAVKFPERGFVITYRKPLRDYFLDYLFFIFRVLFIVALPILIIMFLFVVNSDMFSTVTNLHNQNVQIMDTFNGIFNEFNKMFG